MARWLLAVVCLLAGLGLVGDSLLGKAQADLYLDNFSAQADDSNVWSVTGFVYGADPSDTFVYIDGVIGGNWLYVEADGSFLGIYVVDPSVNGGVTAQGFSVQGDSSNIAEDVIN
jgi:hypothetical protein